MEVIIIFDILNDYVLGIYSSELTACVGIMKDLKENFDLDNQHGDENWDEYLEFEVSNDFKIYKIKLDEGIHYGIYNNEINTGKYVKNGEELKYETFNDVKQRIRELKIDSLI